MDSFQFIFLFILLVKMLEKPNWNADLYTRNPQRRVVTLFYVDRSKNHLSVFCAAQKLIARRRFVSDLYPWREPALNSMQQMFFRRFLSLDYFSQYCTQ